MFGYLVGALSVGLGGIYLVSCAMNKKMYLDLARKLMYDLATINHPPEEHSIIRARLPEFTDVEQELATLLRKYSFDPERTGIYMETHSWGRAGGIVGATLDGGVVRLVVTPAGFTVELPDLNCPHDNRSDQISND